MISKTVQSLKTIIESNLDLEHPQAKSPHGAHLAFKKKARAFAPKMNAKNPKKISLAILPQLRKEKKILPKPIGHSISSDVLIKQK